MRDILRLDVLGKRFVQMCADVFPFAKGGTRGLLYLACEKIHSIVHAATEILRWGNLINCSGEAAEGTHKINVKGPGANLNHRESDGCTLLNHARRKATVKALGVAIQGNLLMEMSFIFEVAFNFLLRSARIDDNDPEYLDDHWTYQSGKPNARVTYPLDSDRFWSAPGALEGDASGRCLASGVRCNIWARARRRRDITHMFRGGGEGGKGWGALRWQETVGAGGVHVRFGTHRLLPYLAKKIANFLHEYKGHLFPTLNLPQLPADPSKVDIHAMLKPIHIARLLRRLQVRFAAVVVTASVM